MTSNEYPGACDHPSVTLARQTNSAGAVTYVDQCDRCGVKTHAHRGRDLTPEQRENAKPFDRARREAHWANVSQQHRAASEQRDREWQAQYEAYLQTPAWRHRRVLVLRRANGVCEGCMSAPATQVHHKTYAHVGNELLFELAAVCDDCHERAHEPGPDWPW